ncbi:MAG: glycosyltransferase family 9 protein [Acidithiobacillus sp.]|jgi:ADP-heptose:LPS heptosyltransferase|uniref:glycosyltransferase family 9 protein n=1 Tax=Acidithiobacillus sp. TaxID=1872118 RepID=UPI00355F4AC6
MPRPLPIEPRRILLIKSHSAGIGDILRSSAAWAVLKKRWPDAELHLVFLTRWPGYPSEALIQEHHLLSSAHFLPMQEGRFAGIRGVGPRIWRRLLPELRRIAQEVQPDLIIDHEPFGIETSIAARWVRHFCAAPAVGVNQVLGRGWFYDYAGPGLQEYARRHELSWPMDYTERDFAALAALGLERDGQRIVLQETAAGRAFRKVLQSRLPVDRPVIGLNIGCGTPDAVNRRPPMGLLVAVAQRLHQEYFHQLLLMGAPNERAINAEFIAACASFLGGQEDIIDLSGETTLSGLTGAIASCDVFVSSDSGPYHMAIGLGVPTVALFNFPNAEAYHQHSEIFLTGQRNVDDICLAVMSAAAREEGVMVL